MTVDRFRGVPRLAVSTTVLTGLVLAATATAAGADPRAAAIGLRSAKNRAGVICVQAALGLPRNGHFTRRVAGAVQRFQRGRGLPADGVVGRQTGQALYELGTAPESCYRHLPTY